MNEQNLIWVDCEFSNIDYSVGSIIEIAVIVTDSELNVLGTPVQFVVNQPESVLELSSDWTKEHLPHVLEASRASTISLEQAESEILAYVSAFTEKH